MKQIPLTKGYVAIVDDVDYEVLEKFKWKARVCATTLYAEGNSGRGATRTTIGMHRLVLGVTDPRIHVDHKDHNGLNNQRSNLRSCTRSQNQANRKLDKDSTSGIKGVCWDASHAAWRAQIGHNGKRIYLGLFPDKEAAAEAYATAAKKHFGEFALAAKVSR